MAVDYFLKIDGIEGESEDDVHANEIELASFTWGEQQTGTFAQGGGSGAGKVRMNNFDFTMRTNKSSPKLALACAKGDHIPNATLTCRKAGGGQQEFYKIVLTDVLVAGYENFSDNPTGAGVDGDLGYSVGLPTDKVALNFGKIEFEYRPQKKDGSLDNPVKTGYNLKTNKPV